MRPARQPLTKQGRWTKGKKAWNNKGAQHRPCACNGNQIHIQQKGHARTPAATRQDKHPNKTPKTSSKQPKAPHKRIRRGAGGSDPKTTGAANSCLTPFSTAPFTASTTRCTVDDATLIRPLVWRYATSCDDSAAHVTIPIRAQSPGVPLASRAAFRAVRTSPVRAAAPASSCWPLGTVGLIPQHPHRNRRAMRGRRHVHWPRHRTERRPQRHGRGGHVGCPRREHHRRRPNFVVGARGSGSWQATGTQDPVNARVGNQPHGRRARAKGRPTQSPDGRCPKMGKSRRSRTAPQHVIRLSGARVRPRRVGRAAAENMDRAGGRAGHANNLHPAVGRGVQAAVRAGRPGARVRHNDAVVGPRWGADVHRRRRARRPPEASRGRGCPRAMLPYPVSPAGAATTPQTGSSLGAGPYGQRGGVCSALSDGGPPLLRNGRPTGATQRHGSPGGVCGCRGRRALGRATRQTHREGLDDDDAAVLHGGAVFAQDELRAQLLERRQPINGQVLMVGSRIRRLNSRPADGHPQKQKKKKKTAKTCEAWSVAHLMTKERAH